MWNLDNCPGIERYTPSDLQLCVCALSTEYPRRCAGGASAGSTEHLDSGGQPCAATPEPETPNADSLREPHYLCSAMCGTGCARHALCHSGFRGNLSDRQRKRQPRGGV